MGKALTDAEFKKRLAERNGKVFTDDVYHNLTTSMDFYCEKNHHWNNRPDKVLIGQGCPYCCGNKIIKGETDLWTLRPDIAAMLEDPNIGYIIGIGHKGKHSLVCPDCKTKQCKSISMVCRYGFSCNVCSDGRSYPNKLMAAMLEMLHVTYEPEYIINGADYRYDFFLSDYNIIIEMHGVQHYEEAPFTDRTLAEEQANDYNKLCFAKKNNIAQYIVIDCRESEFNFIWKNINQSSLSSILDLTSVDVQRLVVTASKTLFKQILELWNKEYGTTAIINELKIDRSTALKYLKVANNAGLIDYSTKESVRRGELGHNKRVNQYDKTGIFINTFRNSEEAFEKTGIDASSIRKCCNHTAQSAGGYLWFDITDSTQPDLTKMVA